MLTMMNNERIPWKRLFAEAVAIVLSILLAFGIDAWWDERNERIEEEELLLALQIEFEANRDEVASVIKVHENALQYAANLVSLTNADVLALPAEEASRHVRYFAHPRTFDPVRGTVDSMTDSGKIGVLQDRKLRDALTTFINIVEDAKEDREYMSQWAMIVWKELAENGGPYWSGPEGGTKEACFEQPTEPGCFISNAMSFLPAVTVQDLLRHRNNSTLMGYVNRSHENSARYVSEVREAQMQIETILELLNRSL